MIGLSRAFDKINWDAVRLGIGKNINMVSKRNSSSNQFPWNLVQRIGVLSRQAYTQCLQASTHMPRVAKPDWYYRR